MQALDTASSSSSHEVQARSKASVEASEPKYERDIVCSIDLQWLDEVLCACVMQYQ